MRILQVVAIGALTLAFALAPPRTAAACTCAVQRPHLLATAPDGSFPAALPLLVASPAGADFWVEDAAGRQILPIRLVELPRLGLCETPWYLTALDGDPPAPGDYRLVRGANDADAFTLSAGKFTTVHADLTISLRVETHDPRTPVESLCADPAIADRAYSRTAHLSFVLSARDEALPIFVTARVPDPETPGGLTHASLVRPIDPSNPTGAPGPEIIDLPLEDGADACADVMGFDAAAHVAVAERLCATDAPETRTIRTTVVVPLVEPTGLERRERGCAVAGPDRRLSPAVVLFAALGIILCAWRRRRPHTSTRTG